MRGMRTFKEVKWGASALRDLGRCPDPEPDGPPKLWLELCLDVDVRCCFSSTAGFSASCTRPESMDGIERANLLGVPGRERLRGVPGWEDDGEEYGRAIVDAVLQMWQSKAATVPPPCGCA